MKSIDRRLSLLGACMVSVALLTGCASAQSSASSSQVTNSSAQQDVTSQEQSSQSAAVPAAAVTLANGTYPIEVTTDSSMFRSDSCELAVQDGAYTATLVLPGEGFSRLYFGTAEEAATANDDQIYDYALNDEGKYSFVIPVAKLEEELHIAAYGQRRDRWYDHTIVFHAPAADASS